jgi:hypothetical protein
MSVSAFLNWMIIVTFTIRSCRLMIKPLVFTFLIACLLPFNQLLMAQDNKPVRMEIPVKDDSDIYKVVPCGQNGLSIIYLSSDTDEQQNMLWVAALLDTDLKENWRKSFPLPKGFVLEEALYTNNRLICFLHSPRGVNEDNFRIIDIRLENGELTETTRTVPEKSGVAYFSAGEQFAVAGINIRNEESVILAYNFNNSQISVISPGVSENVVIESISIDKPTGVISAVIRTLGSARKRAYYLVKSHSNGQIISNLQLSKFDDNRMINTAFAYRVDGNTDLIIGSYGRSSRARTIEGIESVGVASTGFFSVVIRNNTEENANFYEFTDFGNFFRYLRRPSDLNIRRGNNRNERGRDYSMDHDILAHEVFRWKDQYVFIAEAYYPEYRSVTTMVYDYYGRPYPSTYSVFEGFRYLTTFIAGFDQTGNLLWNNDLELRNILSQKLKRRVLAWEDTEGLVLAYVNDGKITSKLIDQDKTIESPVSSDIESLSPRDRIFDDANSSIEQWYNNYFVVYGYQNIRNSYVSSRSNKNVFYINKMAYY